MASTKTSVVPAGSKAAVSRVKTSDTAVHASNNIAKRSVIAKGYSPLGQTHPTGVQKRKVVTKGL